MYDRYTIDDKIHINKGPTVYLQFNLRTLAFAGLDCQCRMWAYFDECPWEKCETRSRRQWRKHESGRGTKSSASQLGRFGLRSLDFCLLQEFSAFVWAASMLRSGNKPQKEHGWVWVWKRKCFRSKGQGDLNHLEPCNGFCHHGETCSEECISWRLEDGSSKISAW